MKEEVLLYKSRTRLINLIETIGLNIRINDKFSSFEHDKYIEIENLAPIVNSNKAIQEPFKFSLQRKTDNKFSISYVDDSGQDIFKNDLPLQQEIFFAGYTFKLKSFKKLDVNESISIVYNKPARLVPYISSKLFINEIVQSRSLYDQGKLLRISYFDSNIPLAKQIINNSNILFIEERISENSKKASQSLEFINDQIDKIQVSLSQSENNLNKFKKDNLSLDIEKETIIVLEQLSDIEKKISEIELELAQYKDVYNQENPLLAPLISQKAILDQKKSELNEVINKLPSTQQEYIDLYRQFDVNQTIYKELLNRRLEFSLMEASTLANLKIVDNAYSYAKISPRGFQSIVIFTLFGLMLELFML